MSGFSQRENDNIYYNVDIINGRTTSTGSENDPIASFEESRDIPIITNLGKYKMAVIRFTMNGIRDLPLFIPTIEKNQPNPNKTIYKITMESQGFVESRSVIFIPELQNSNLLTAPQSQSVLDEYYYVHTYSHFVDLINNTFQTLTDSLNSQVSTAIISPKMIYNTNNKKFDLYFPKGDLKMFFNANLNNLISHYPGKKSRDKDLLYYEIIPVNTLGISNFDDDYLKVEQEEYSIGSFWSPIASIVFTTNMPIIAEGVAPPLVYGDSNTQTSTGSNINFENIITDISLATDDAYEYKQFVSYIPNEYRYLSLENNSTPLNRISVQVYWKSRLTSQLIPLRMSNLSNISLKLLFSKK